MDPAGSEHYKTYQAPLHNKDLLSRENNFAWVYFWNLIPAGEMKLLPTPVSSVLPLQFEGENIVLMEQNFKAIDLEYYSQETWLKDKAKHLEEGKKHNPKKTGL